MAKRQTLPRLRHRAGLKRVAGLLDEVRSFGELREEQPGTFRHGSVPFLHFHYHPDGRIQADVRLSRRRFIGFDVSDEAGQQEVLSAIEEYLSKVREPRCHPRRR